MMQRYFEGKTVRPPGKEVGKYEDLPVTGDILYDFISYRIEAEDIDTAIYFRLTPVTMGKLEDVLPPESVSVRLLNPLNIQDEVFHKSGPTRSRYLYAIDDDGIHVALDEAPAIAKRGKLTHTNLVSQAYFAGEVFFLSKHEVILTPNSGRFGLSPYSRESSVGELQKLWEMTIDCWTDLGFHVYPSILDLRDMTKRPHCDWNGRVLAEATALMFAATSSME